ncbi:MAG: glycosyltransferase family 39 protein [Chloroflexi bacterium]|nr:glycosyltransferase family 39 protein [Chloroflexota bacterium]
MSSSTAAEWSEYDLPIERAGPSSASAPGMGRGRQRGLLAMCGALVFALVLGARLLAHDLVITADEDNWMRRAGGFAYGLLNGQLGRTYQNGHPGVTTMWVATLTLGPERTVQYADRVHGLRLVGRVAGFWDALVAARVGFAVATALLVAGIALLAGRLFGPLVGLLAGLAVGLEPFYIAISQLVHMDALLSGCMVASVLAVLVRWQRGGGRRWLVLSGVLGGLAFLSKVPALYLVGFTPLLGVACAVSSHVFGSPANDTPTSGSLSGRADGGCADNGQPLDVDALVDHTEQGRASGTDAPATGSVLDTRTLVLRLLVDLAVWGVTFTATWALLWPAVWALGPMEVLDRVADFTRETGGQPHEQGTFFWGEPRADPGPFFYPVAVAFRLAPLTLLGLVLLAGLWRRLSLEARHGALALLAYCLGFGLMMTLGPKKFDRYLLPIFPALGVLAALGLGVLLGGAGETLRHSTAGHLRWGARPRGVRAVAGAAIVGLALWPAAAAYPYYLSYYNPLLGGGAAATRTVMVGNGEGLDQVARWLNDRPNADNLWIVSHSFDILQPLIAASGEPLRDRVPSNADYVVLYRFQEQIGHSPRVVAEYQRRAPEYVATIGGIEYAWVYRGPHLAAVAPESVTAAGPASSAGRVAQTTASTAGAAGSTNHQRAGDLADDARARTDDDEARP